ncbi:DUF6804 family protein [Arachidicoccus terrestris]|uniref:DUF6804 family protein n=1 Tax=Arachidicoccus terrestris TaxID=2875539 RepID=UPI003742F7F7
MSSINQIIRLIFITLLSIALLQMPESYYQSLKLIIGIGMIVFAYRTDIFNTKRGITELIIGIIFIATMDSELTRRFWQIIDIASIIFLVYCVIDEKIKYEVHKKRQ